MDGLPTLQALMRKTTTWLEGKGIRNARREAEWIFSRRLGLSRLELYTRFDMLLGEDEQAQLRQAVARRGRREPLAYILGDQPFCGLELHIDARVLVPRPETEALVEALLADPALAADQPLCVADIGTGSGAIALALARARPQWEVHAVDYSEDALALARENGRRLQLQVQWHHGDLHEGLPQRPWALWVANLPYIAEAERALCDPETAYEPAMALFADDNGLALIRRVVQAAPSYLQPGGVLWLEHGFRHGEAVPALCRQAGLEETRCLRDGDGLDRLTRSRRAP